MIAPRPSPRPLILLPRSLEERVRHPFVAVDAVLAHGGQPRSTRSRGAGPSATLPDQGVVCGSLPFFTNRCNQRCQWCLDAAPPARLRSIAAITRPLARAEGRAYLIHTRSSQRRAPSRAKRPRLGKAGAGQGQGQGSHDGPLPEPHGRLRRHGQQARAAAPSKTPKKKPLSNRDRQTPPARVKTPKSSLRPRSSSSSRPNVPAPR